MTALLEIERLSKSFTVAPLFEQRRHTQALRNVTLTIPKGGCVGLVGESGSGKSTLARCVLGLERPDAGSICFEGRPLDRRGAEGRSIAGQIQPIFQNPTSSLNPRRRVRDIIAEPLAVHTSMAARERADEVRRLLDLVALPEGFADRYPGQLSGGQCQRVSIARALALQPKLIVADEATSALDVLVQKQIVDLLARLRAEFGMAILFVSHNLAVTQELCEEMAVLYRGEIVEVGKSDEIIARPSHDYTGTLIGSVPVLAGGPPAPAAESIAADAAPRGQVPS